MALFARIWHGFLRLFGLDACPVPPGQARAATPQQRATRARLERLLRKD